jgi:hypothetical protein
LLQCASTALVALGAANAYRHGREFALRFGAVATTATLWPLVVDDLLTVATVELWKTGHDSRDSGEWKAWMAFLFGLCANIAAAPELCVRDRGDRLPTVGVAAGRRAAEPGTQMPPLRDHQRDTKRDGRERRDEPR